MKMRELWKRLTTTRYARALEMELARMRADGERMRAENRALLNSILGIAGVPPLPASVEDLAAVDPVAAEQYAPETSGVATRDDPAQKRRMRRALARPVAAGGGSSPHVAVPMRKRSWQQINRLLEFESGRKEKAGTDALVIGRT